MNHVNSPLITVDELKTLNTAVVLHASMGAQPPTEVIAGAFVADLEDDFSHTDHPLPHTVPGNIQEVFASYGISDDTPVVVYDSDGATAPRVWWLARVAGLTDVRVLDGGFRAWQRAGLPTEAPSRNAESGVIVAQPLWDLLIDAPGVANTSRQVVDARSHDRFVGAVKEPRPGLRSGHIPGSVNVPFTEVYRSDGTWKSPEELAELFPTRPRSFLVRVRRHRVC
ncbi:rhodanese-like domain-containing protein [Corynebacterium breve]|uniref:Rhodanese-like domain-containing protein n=1 Tax=Corynebacterium breve TaxID=3049799 RepID=A0ABY8VGZ7_9CORY|nr:rhodanese-like domain-containing protein [Corynebacterium breve]WIM68789.1 rhodanese-like domain-containing protein [Corynebacterium breve]